MYSEPFAPICNTFTCHVINTNFNKLYRLSHAIGSTYTFISTFLVSQCAAYKLGKHQSIMNVY